MKLAGIQSFMRSNRTIILIVLTGFLLRLLFMLVFAGPFFGRKSIYEDGDTWAWAKSFQLLWESGTYTVNQYNVYGFFGRMPVYSFFIGFFWLLCGKNWQFAYEAVAWIQVLLDAVAIYYIYRTSLNVFPEKRRVSLIVAGLYAFYPFIIVWNPVVYSESLSVFLLIIALYLLSCEVSARNIFWSGVFLGLAALTRPQIMIMFPVFFLGLILFRRSNNPRLVRNLLIFMLSIAISYGLWPVRNYLFHHKIVLTQDLRGFDNWNIDVLSFLQYIYAVKTDWNPQFSSIIHNKPVSFPKRAYLSAYDSLKLERAVYLSQNCGSGFSHKRGYWKASIDTPNCNVEIAGIFNELRERQVKYNPWDFYILIPMQNLSKAVFKSNIRDNRISENSITSLIFYIRTLLILLGISGLIFMLRAPASARVMAVIILLYVSGLYLVLCGGPWVQCRNIEIRYFLQADILLLIPAGYMIYKLGRLFGSD